MSAGMLTLTNNSAVVTGSGTAFTTELTAGDFLVVTAGGITYTLPVQSVDSDTQLTLPSKYKGPAQSGLAWSVVPRATQNQITAALVAQTTEALRGQNYDKQNWQAVFSNSGDITVVLPDGSTFSGPSWRKIVDLLNSIDPDLIQTLATQIHADAQQVAADRTDVDTKASQVQIDAQTASTAASAATTANTTAQQAKADSLTAKTAAEAARDAAQSANPDNQLKKSQNLADVSSIPAARSNLDVFSRGEIGPEFITGLNLSVAGAVITCGPGAAYVHGGGIVRVAGAITTTVTGLTANTWRHVYLYLSGSTPTIEAVTTEPVDYSYPAKQKTGDATRRYLGSFRVDQWGGILSQLCIDGHCFFKAGDSLHRIMSNGLSTTKAAIAINSEVPSTANSLDLLILNASTASLSYVDVSSTSTGGAVGGLPPNTKLTLTLPADGYPYIYYLYGASAPSPNGVYIDVGGYTYAR